MFLESVDVVSKASDSNSFTLNGGNRLVAQLHFVV
jgi:hypothetical protein